MTPTTWFGAPKFPTELENPELKDIVQVHTMKMITGDMGIEEGFASMEKQLYQNNLAQVLKERQEWYDKNKK